MKTVEPLDLEHAPLTGVTLIEASAGTGKTYTLAALVLRLLLEGELAIHQILVVTYTRAATAELRVRIRKRITQAIEALEGIITGDPVLDRMAAQAQDAGQAGRKRRTLESALQGFDEAAIFTIHGFCQRVLKRHAFESGVAFEAELSEEQRLMVEEVVHDFWASELEHASDAFVAALEDNKVTIATLLRFLQRALPNPELRIIPDAEPVDVAALERAYAVARAHAAQLWAADAARITALLGRPGMHKTHYGSKLFDEQLPTLARLSQLAAAELPDWLGYLSTSGMRCNKGFAPPVHPFFDACEALLEAKRQLCAALNQNVLAFQHKLLTFARDELARRGEDAGLMGFDDLLLKLSQALHGPEAGTLIAAIRDTYPAALIDEFQDTDPVQCEVFRLTYTAPLAARPAGALFLIGDPKQAIYAFRGADVFAYMAAASTAADRVNTLSVNRRSDPSLLRGIAQVFGRAQLPFVFEEITFREVTAPDGERDRMPGASFEILLMRRPGSQQDKSIAKATVDDSLPQRVAAEIAQLLASGARIDDKPVEPRDIAVLCRTNLQAFSAQAALRELGIPAVLDGDASVFDSAMAEELGRWLRAMVEPGDAANLRAALATSGFALTADDLLQLEHDEAAWDGWVASFHGISQLWQARGFMRALHALCDEHGVIARLLALPDGERRYADLMHLAELLHEEAQRTRKGPRALVDFFRRVRTGAAQRTSMALEDVQLRLESDAHAVTLTTIHKSKGLEFPIVYCPYLWASAALFSADRKSPQFHDRACGDRPTLVLARPEPEQVAAAARETLAEQLRLLYVALTRAKHRLCIVWGALPGFEDSALGYLLHQTGSGDSDALRSSTSARLEALSDREIEADLLPLSAAPGASIAIRSLAEAGSAPRFRPLSRGVLTLAPRVSQRRMGDPQVVSSFSSLAASGHTTIAAPLEPEGLDRDAEAAIAPATLPLPASGPLALADFPAGAGFGHLVHAIYENADFQVAEPAGLHDVVATALADYAAASDWKPALSAAIFDTLHAPLQAAGPGLPMLASVGAIGRCSELEFLFPVANDGTAGKRALTPSLLGRTLLEHARDEGERAYAARLMGLRFAPLRGFLRGFIDLVVEHDARFYVLDYKSNQLGPSVHDYRRDRLDVVMRRHHYVLQYLVYTVAVDRYLKLRVPGYSYEQHFGGVYYLFVRGMSANHEPGSGVLFERPSRELIEALSALL